MAGKVRAWVWVVAGVAALGLVALVAIVGAGFYFMTRHLDTAPVTPAEAAAALNAARTRFVDQKPIIELDSQGQFVRAHTEGRPVEQGERPTELHLLVHDPGDRRLVRFRLPFWLLRTRAGRGTVDLDGTRIDLHDLKLTVDDLERYGPALLLDHQTPQGHHILAWSE